MKKINKNNFKLNKEVISSLSEDSLSQVVGGYQSNEQGVKCYEISVQIKCDSVDWCYTPTFDNQCVVQTKLVSCVAEQCFQTRINCTLKNCPSQNPCLDSVFCK